MVPSGAGLGSSAAVTVATLGTLHGVGGAIDPKTIAREGFEVEHEVQGRASPIDTSTASAGGGLLVLPKPQDGLLWTIKRDARQWCLHRTDLPAFDLVAAGRLMDRNHTLLNQLGVGHPMLDRLADAARKTSYGAKLTGAGGGGSIVALSDRPAETTEAIRAAGGKAFVVTSDPIGVASLS